MLIVHLKETRTAAQTDVFGLRLRATGTAPPMYFFYRVPEQFRVAVEKAIRGCNKWSE